MQAAETFIDVPDGVMIAFYPPPALARRLALPDGEPPEDLHITLALPGKLSSLTPEQRKRLPDIVRGFALISKPLEGKFSGVTEFPAHEGVKPVVLLVDVPGLPAWRQRLVEVLALNGYTVASDHGFIPHMTLKYAPEAEQVSVEAPDTALSFDRVVLMMGTEKRTYRLGGAPAVPEPFRAPVPPVVDLARANVARAVAAIARLYPENFAARRKRPEQQAVDDYEQALLAAYDDWVAAGLPQFAAAEDDDSREELLALLLLLLLARLRGRGEETLPAALGLGLGKVAGAKATPAMLAALQEAIASNGQYLETSLIPAIGAAVRGALAAGGDVAAALGGLRARVAMYANVMHALIQRVTGLAAEDKPVRWHLDHSIPLASHCDDCLSFGDADYPSFDAMLQVTGGLVPGSPELKDAGNCRCWLTEA